MGKAETLGSAPGDARGLKKWSEEIETITEVLRSGGSLHLIDTHGIARAWIVHGVMARHGGPAILVLPDIKTRRRVTEALNACKRLLGPSFVPREPLNYVPFPSWELTPYTDEWMHPRVASQRVKVLFSLINRSRAVFLTTPEALINRFVEPGRFRRGVLTLETGMTLDMEVFFRELMDRGYIRSTTTELPGDLSVRGGVIDLFSPLEDTPVRIELEGDEVASLRHFDPSTQRTTAHVTSTLIGPVQEMYPQRPLNEIRERLYTLPVSREGKRAIRNFLKRLERGENLADRIWSSPFLFEMNANIFSYLPSKAPLIFWDPEECRTTLLHTLEKARKLHEKARQNNPILPNPDTLFLPFNEFEEKLFSRPHLSFGLSLQGNSVFRSLRSLTADPFMPRNVKKFRGTAWPWPVMVQEIRRLQNQGHEIWVVESSEENRNTLQKKLAEQNLLLPVSRALACEADKGCRGGIVPGEIPEGCVFPALKLAIVTRYRPWALPPKPDRLRKGGIAPSEVETLKQGDPLVHLDYGIGLYRGLKPMEVLGKKGEFLEMEYARGDKLLVPVDKVDRVQRYVGSGDTPPPLDLLGSKAWEKKKERLREDVAKTARELLELYAARKAIKGYAFDRATEGLAEFEAAFPYPETPDQKKAIEDIYRDMASETPMDRLVCGDVGFGKTEVAMRAAFKAVMEGKQVAILVPTTILAEQHYVHFTQRFTPYPVRVELLSRFRSPAAQKSVVRDLSKGTVDIVIGTHRLLQKDIKFRDLGLLVIDEEHRFGVIHKELLKKLSTTVDVLTLTATPIPRTLQMSLSGLRDLSLINTPPRTRLPIITKIVRFRKDIIVEGIERELARGGQVFFVHNRVKTISKIAQFIQELVPSATVVSAHGQMDEKELENVMLAFMHHEIDILVCTTIIESGVDIPNVNTLFVHHAEQFGLSTLYQLRGRIGRSDRQAYAYFLVPHRSLLPREVIKRLQSLQEFSSLGSGFKLSMMDLNLRGGGDLLGCRQSGRIAEIGFELYTHIIEEEVKKLTGQWKEPKVAAEVQLPFSTLLPEDYIPEMGLRLTFYRRLSRLETPSEVDEIEAELIDRFGPLPEEARNLLIAVKLKTCLTSCGITSLHGKNGQIVLGFAPSGALNRTALVSLLQRDPNHYKLTPAQKLIIRTTFPSEFSAYVKKIYTILKQLTSCDKFLAMET